MLRVTIAAPREVLNIPPFWGSKTSAMLSGVVVLLFATSTFLIRAIQKMFSLIHRHVA